MRNPCRTMLVLGLLASSTECLEAQTRMAVRAGANIATLGGADISVDSRFGLKVSAAVVVPLSGNLSLEAGAGYSQKGATETERGADSKLSLDYIDIPVLLRLGVPTEGRIFPYFVLGPALSVKAGCDVSGSSEGVSASLSCAAANFPVKSMDFGAIGGIGLAISTFGALMVYFDARYGLGFTSVDDSAAPDDVKNRVWSLLAGVGFPLGQQLWSVTGGTWPGRWRRAPLASPAYHLTWNCC